MIQNLLRSIIQLFIFLIELGIIYKLYPIIYNKFFLEKSEGDQAEIRINIFRSMYLITALYIFEITGFPISRVLIDTGILWVAGTILSLFLLYRITNAIEKNK